MTLPGWYWQVKAIFDAQGVPPSVWVPILNVESGGNPQAVGDSGCSVGLFQANMCGGQGKGYTAEQLKNPVFNAQVVAPQIGAAVKRCGTDNMTCIVMLSQRPDPATYPKYEAARAAFERLGENWQSMLSESLTYADDVIDKIPGAVGNAAADALGIPAWLRNPAGTIQDAREAIIFGVLGVLLVGIGVLGFVSQQRRVASLVARATPIGRAVNVAKAVTR